MPSCGMRCWQEDLSRDGGLAGGFWDFDPPVRDAVTRLVAQGVLQQGARNSAIVPHLCAANSGI